MKRGKNYNASAEKIERSRIYEANEALALAIDTATAKFDETIELHVKLGVDPKNADQQVRGSVVLPNGTGKNVRVLVIAKGDKAEIAKTKMPDLNAASLEAAISMVKGTARSMGVLVEE